MIGLDAAPLPEDLGGSAGSYSCAWVWQAWAVGDGQDKAYANKLPWAGAGEYLFH